MENEILQEGELGKDEESCKKDWFLTDERNGKERPWREKKINSLKVADSYLRLGVRSRAIEVQHCGSTLSFEISDTGKKTLCGAFFCKKRLCPMCQWRKSLKVFRQVSRVMDEAEAEYKTHVPLFLTLTVKNCKEDKLSETLDIIFDGWYQLVRNRKTEIVEGWFRALEITYSVVKDEYHPHLHVIVMVDKTYFKSKKYMQTHDWVKLWRTAAKLDYDPICDIRKVNKQGQKKHKSIAEIAKYVTKDKDYILDDFGKMDKVVWELSSALHNRRLYAFGGTLKKIAKKLEIGELAEGDLVHIDEDTVRSDLVKVVETYDWGFGVSDFVRRR
jgi:plasmid rolling circle replication initiator protein Rep